MIRDAAEGDDGHRDDFARRYEPAVRAYLRARWRTQSHLQEVSDAVQEVFVECFKEGGVLASARRERPGGFRAFLFGVCRNVSLRFEKRGRKSPAAPAVVSDMDLDALEVDEESLSQVFDRAWATSIMREAAEVQQRRAAEDGDAAMRRVELLKLRFREAVPIRDIAKRWQCDAAELHREYARARKEFREALIETMKFYHPDSPEDARREAEQLIRALAT